MSYDTELLRFLQVSDSDLVEFVSDNAGLRGVDTSRMSRLLIAQLTSMRKHRTMNSFSVTDILQVLEGAGRSGLKVREKPFKHTPLNGLWKAHFFDAKFLWKNLVNEWGLFNEESKKFETMVNEVANEEAQAPTYHGLPGRLAHKFVVDGFKARADKQKMTGEWVIFGKHEGKNYYLCVAAHTTKETDKELYAGIERYCKPDFPFLFGGVA